LIDDFQLDQVDSLQRNCEESLRTDPDNRSSLCGAPMSYIDRVSGGVLSYDARIFDYDWDPIENVISEFLNTCGQK